MHGDDDDAAGALTEEWLAKELGALGAEQDARHVDRQSNIESRRVLSAAELDAKVGELLARAESASLLADEECLEEVQVIADTVQRLVGDEFDEPGSLAGQRLSDQQRDSLAAVARRCAELKGKCTQRRLRTDLASLHRELALHDSAPDRPVAQMIEEHRAGARHVDAIRKPQYSAATREALSELAMLESLRPQQQQQQPQQQQAPTEELVAFERQCLAASSEELFNCQDRIELLKEQVGLPVVFLKAGSFPIGMSLQTPSEISFAERRWKCGNPGIDSPSTTSVGAHRTPPADRALWKEPATPCTPQTVVSATQLPQPGSRSRRLPGERLQLKPVLERQQAELAGLEADHQRYRSAHAQFQGTVLVDAAKQTAGMRSLPEVSGAVGPCLHGGIMADGGVLHEGVAVSSLALTRDGIELSDTPAARALQLLHNLPPLPELQHHVREGLHSDWNEAERCSVNSLACSASADGAAPQLSCHPPDTYSLNPCFMATDVVRLGHVRRMRDHVPGFKQRLREVGIELVSNAEKHRGRPESPQPQLPNVQWYLDLDNPCPNVLPEFMDGVAVGVTAHGKDTGPAGAIDEEDDPACEVPFAVAVEIAKACGARLPSWQEWEVAVRGPNGARFPWGDCADQVCIDSDVMPPVPGVRPFSVAVIKSFGWLRSAPSPLGLLGLARYGQEWNTANHDLGDATGGIAAKPTTHVLRSFCDHGMLNAADLPGAAHRTFTLPCAAAYGLPHRQTHCAAFRLVFVPPSQKPHTGPAAVDEPISLGTLAVLLGVCSAGRANRARVEGLLGPPEVVEPCATSPAERWMWPAKGCSAEVDVFVGCRVTSVTVYERVSNRPMWAARFPGAIDGESTRFPLTKEDLRLRWSAATVLRRGSCHFYMRSISDWDWWAGPSRRPGPGGESRPEPRLRPDRRFTADQKTVARVAFSASGSVTSITLSLCT
eukprot:TRINITY_DN5630_c1_g2_i1.p1 TRINITY_DN5630_c1_g2~~TRINITY_DN5630_c1_g2_i1.p1  ORF type:complete len:964 (+),score=273.59 TRINITY_DN5630_c1_g2_i1:57-2894(+)